MRAFEAGSAPDRVTRAMFGRIELAADFATDEAVAWRVLGAMFLVGGCLTLTAIPLSSDDRHPLIIALAALTAILTGIGLWHRAAFLLPVRLISFPLAFGTFLITLIVLASGQPDGRYSLFYVWVALESCYFLAPRTAMIHMASMAASYGLALIVLGGGIDQWTLVVGTSVTTGWLVGALRARIQRLSVQTKTDPLTGLCNRRGFDEMIEHALDDARQRQQRMSLVLFDLDNFKLINDRYGHATGDGVLRGFAEICAALGSPGARLGGDEFALLVDNQDTSATCELVAQIRRGIETASHLTFAGLTVSAGIAAFPAHGDSPRALMQAADQALYQAKRSGRDQVVSYGPAIEPVRREAELGDRPSVSQLQAVILLSETLDLRDTSTSAHSQTVARYADLIGAELGFSGQRRERVRLAGIVHDLGKIGVPDHVLLKPGQLTAEEWEMMRRHPETGARILEGAGLHDLASWVVAHHERPDGTGYPLGLSAAEIPLEASILAVADAYEAMRSRRPYRDGMTEACARAELLRHRGTQFDPAVVDALLRVLRSAEHRAGGEEAPPRTRALLPI